MDADKPFSMRSFLRFTPALEREFELEKSQDRAAHFTRCGFLGLFLYDFFLLYHWQLTPDRIGLACMLSLAIFSPMMLVVIFGPTRSSSAVVREVSWTVMPIVAVVFFMLIASLSESPHSSLSFYSAVLVMIFTTAVQRLRFRYTVIANVGMIVAVIFALVTSSAHDAHTRAASLIFFAVALILMVMAAYAFEREARLTYLAERQTRLLNEELRRVSQTDPLTGLWNRRHLQALMASAWAEAEPETEMAVLLIDVDHFKRFNDDHGHTAGDTCLVEVARCLTDVVERDAVAVRYGGEEFLVFISSCDVYRAADIAHRVHDRLRSRMISLGAGGEARVTASIGVASSTIATTAGALIAKADRALYEAKAFGRDQTRIALPGGSDPTVASVAA